MESSNSPQCLDRIVESFLTGIYFILFTIKIKNNNLNIGMVYSNHKKQYEKNHVNWLEI